MVILQMTTVAGYFIEDADADDSKYEDEYNDEDEAEEWYCDVPGNLNCLISSLIEFDKN